MNITIDTIMAINSKSTTLFLFIYFPSSNAFHSLANSL